MRSKRPFIGLLILFILASCSSSADWNASFVVWEGDMYELTEEYVEGDENIGKVTKDSDREGTYSGTFSNTYKKGTKLYSIEGIPTDEAIAIEENGTFRKAINSGKYGE
ncbi:hypothetical protein [Sporosarcina sp. OR05]|uniref:hypothetical protein n=1 Tax=Sporosarcina sp. OR05 TaxID=2969819 RepID=UPI00352A926A